MIIVRNINRCLAGIVFLLFLLFSFSSSADEKELRRIMVGLKIYPSVVAADKLIQEKVDAQGYLLLYLLYEDNTKLARELADRLQQVGKIKNIPVKVNLVSIDDFIDGKSPENVSAFLVQSASQKVQKILDRASSSRILGKNLYTSNGNIRLKPPLTLLIIG